MSVKEYEMDDDYKKAAQFLADQIAQRDEFAEQLKLLPPEKRPEGLRLLAELDKAIETGEQKLAEEYESYQNLRRAEDERDTMFDELTENLAGAYVHAKYRNPELIPQLDSVIADMEPDQAQAFRDAIARHESGDLVSIIRREGETREEAEEFLKNYRRRAEEEESNPESEELAERMAMIYIHIKYRHPEKSEEVRAACTNNYTPEEEKAFDERVARLEAGDLISLIAQEGETRGQTEEFLKNYRAERGEQ